MKKVFLQLLVTFFVLGLLISPTTALAQAGEQIRQFEAIIGLSENSSFQVREQIVYDFGNMQRHGIYRTIPVRYYTETGRRSIRIKDISVRDEHSAPYKFETNRSGDYLEIKIGDADVLITGRHEYVITYRVYGAINYFSDYDELYWNVTGNEWPVGIDNVSAEVMMPNVLVKPARSICFVGVYGSEEQCKTQDGASFSADSLSAGEGMTVAISLPKGALDEPSGWERIFWFLSDNPIVAAPVIVGLFLLALWYVFGRDPKGRKVTVAQYDPPEGMSAAQAGTVYDERAENKDVAAGIIQLAVRGYLKIRRLEREGVFSKKIDWQLVPLKPADKSLPYYEQVLMDRLFSYAAPELAGNKDSPVKQVSVTLSSLKNKFYKDMEEVKRQLYNNAVVEGYFPRSPHRTRVIFTTIAAILGFGSIWLSAPIVSFSGATGILSIIATAIIVLVAGYAMPVRTLKGVHATEDIAGLREYMKVAEKDRIEFHNAPAKNPERFERLLPYAMALGVEKEWAKQFADLYSQPPSWYEGGNISGFNSVILVSMMSDFRSSASSTMTSKPSSAAHGGSGFSGGFSGGGFGGGGGGSW